MIRSFEVAICNLRESQSKRAFADVGWLTLGWVMRLQYRLGLSEFDNICELCWSQVRVEAGCRSAYGPCGEQVREEARSASVRDHHPQLINVEVGRGNRVSNISHHAILALAAPGPGGLR